EVDVLLHDRVVLLEHQLLGTCARVLLRHVKEPRAGGRKQLDLLRYGLGHDRGTWFGELKIVCGLQGARTIASAASLSSNVAARFYELVVGSDVGSAEPKPSRPPKPCMRKAHCRPTSAPLMRGSSHRDRP